MDAVIAAGGIPQPDDPLYSYSGGEAKALIEVAGKPMIQWVLDALSDAKTIERVVVIGLTDKSRLTCRKPVFYLSNEGRLPENLRAATAQVLELNPKAKYVLFVSSDIPAITGKMVDWVVNTCMQTKDDLYYNVIPREAMERRFPTSKRTFTALKDMEICGGDMNMARVTIVNQNSDFWNKLFEARKNPAAQAALIGPDIMFRLIFRQLTIADVIERVARRLGLKGRAIVCPYPEIGMDVDKPHQLEIMRADLGRRVRRPLALATPARKSRTERGKRSAGKRPARKQTAKAGPGPAKKRVTSAQPRPRKR
jgi:GTP:adenosylcobinamide-phosphate guanylyltransferase